MSMSFTRKNSDLARQDGKRFGLDQAMTVLCFLIMTTVVILPVVMIIYNTFWDGTKIDLEMFRRVIFREENLAAMKNTVIIAVVSTVFATIIGVFFAWLLGRSDIPMKGLMRWLFSIPFMIPPFLAAMAWDMMFSGRGGASLAAAIRKAYEQGGTDYYMEPLVAVDDEGRPLGKVQDGDTVVFCCRRGEREIELTEMFTDGAFSAVERVKRSDLHFVLFTLYHEKFAGMPVAFGPAKLTDTLAQALSEAGKTQLHCAESEKYAHVTFFFNGGNSEPYPGETDIRIPSPRGVKFEAVPQLSLPEVTEKVISELGAHDFMVVNFANGDVIGHTADNGAKLEAAKCVSENLDKLVKEASAKDYVVMITADHGNLERMTTPKGKPDVAHTSNPVPFVLIDPRGKTAGLKEGKSLSSVAPTALEWMGVKKPEKMTAESLMACTPEDAGRRVLLVILDGWGIGAEDETNPIYIGETEPWKTLFASYPHTLLHASGSWVGLGEGKAGNSEAGHSNLGAGRMVPRDDMRLAAAMEDGSFESNPVFLKAIERTKREGKALHLLAYLTKLSSHGSIVYEQKLAAMAKGLDEVYLHLILDGRSTEPGSTPELVLELERIGSGVIVDCVGRGIVLDRDLDYDKVKRGYDAMVLGIGEKYSIAR